MTRESATPAVTSESTLPIDQPRLDAYVMTEDDSGRVFGERVRLVRGKESRADFAARVGVRERQIIRWEDGDAEPKLSQITKLVTATHRSADWLIGVDAAGGGAPPVAFTAFMSGPLGRDCTQRERAHLHSYALLIGDQLTDAALQLELATFRFIMTNPDPKPPAPDPAPPRKGDSGPRKRSITPKPLKRQA